MEKEKSEVLMVLPKNTIFAPVLLPEDYTIQEGDHLITILKNSAPVATGSLETGRHFGVDRLHILTHSHDPLLYAAVVSRLAIQYESEPTRYPLYIAVDSEDFDLIRTLARLEFMPYLGEWSQASQEDSELQWSQITECMRNEDRHGGPAA